MYNFCNSSMQLHIQVRIRWPRHFYFINKFTLFVTVRNGAQQPNKEMGPRGRFFHPVKLTIVSRHGAMKGHGGLMSLKIKPKSIAVFRLAGINPFASGGVLSHDQGEQRT